AGGAVLAKERRAALQGEIVDLALLCCLRLLLGHDENGDDESECQGEEQRGVANARHRRPAQEEEIEGRADKDADHAQPQSYLDAEDANKAQQGEEHSQAYSRRQAEQTRIATSVHLRDPLSFQTMTGSASADSRSRRRKRYQVLSECGCRSQDAGPSG